MHPNTKIKGETPQRKCRFDLKNSWSEEEKPRRPLPSHKHRGLHYMYKENGHVLYILKHVRQ